jgi:GDP-4-dehydro-6-deoxy-D-mannose reductase
MRILLTGATGFAGGHLAEALVAHGGGVELFALSRRAEWPEDLRHLAARVNLVACDLCDGRAVDEVLRRAQPEQIYHLAGYAHVGQSFGEPDAAWAGNLTATRSLYEGVARWGGRPRILFVGSGSVYGPSDTPEHAHNESCPLRPSSPYAASKAAADLVSYQFAHAPTLDVVRVRPFNHVGPRQSPQYVVAQFARQLAAIERGRQPPVVEVGNLSPLRDLTDVRDVIRAYVLVMGRGRVGEVYNVASGAAHSIQSVLDALIRLARVAVQVRQDPQRVRSAEVAAVRGDSDKVRRETGWAPEFALERTLADTLEYWRRRA